jgi:4-carboxymuconolactone decarboxylase
MTRIPLIAIDQQPDAIRHFMARRGELNLFRLLANAPHVFIGWTQMVDEMFDSPTFSARMRELIILRVAYLQDSQYELSQHLALGRSAGLNEAQIDAITGAGDLRAAGLDHTESVVLELITELCTTRRLRDDTFAAAQAVLGDTTLTELLMIISLYYGLALVLNATDLEPDPTARIHV